MSNENFGFHTEADEVATYFANEIKGKTVLITGCTFGGLGFEAARVVSKHQPALVIVAGRKQEALDDAIEKIKAETPSANLRPLIIDLASLESVRHAAAEVNTYSEAIDVLINNAAIMASPYYTTKDGFEAQFGINHIGPFLFTNLILPKVLASKTGAPRIVNVSSVGHIFSPIRFDDPYFENGKAAFSLHPGGIDTNLTRDVTPEELNTPMKDYDGEVVDWRNLEMKSIPEGTSTHLVAAFDPKIASDAGAYLQDCQIAMHYAKPYAKDDTQASKLWALSEQIVGQMF